MIRHLTRRTTPVPSGSLKDLLAQELAASLSREADAAQAGGPPTNARLLVSSMISRSIEKGDYRGLRFLTDFVGMGEKAEIRREQLRLEKEKAAKKLAEQSRSQDNGMDSSKALEVYLAVQAAMKIPARDRTLEDVLQPPPHPLPDASEK